MTRQEEKEYLSLKKKYGNDMQLKRLIDLYILAQMNEISIRNTEIKNADGLVKEVVGVTAFRIDLYSDVSEIEEEDND